MDLVWEIVVVVISYCFGSGGYFHHGHDGYAHFGLVKFEPFLLRHSHLLFVHLSQVAHLRIVFICFFYQFITVIIVTKYEFGMDDDYKNSYLSSKSGLIFSLKFGIKRRQVNLREAVILGF